MITGVLGDTSKHKHVTNGNNKRKIQITCFSRENTLKALTGILAFILWVFLSWKMEHYNHPMFIGMAQLWGAILITIFGLWIGYRNPLYAIPWVIFLRTIGLSLIAIPIIITKQISILTCFYGLLFLGVAYGLFFGVIVAVLAIIPHLISRLIHNRLSLDPHM